jgi:hypothetical protein
MARPPIRSPRKDITSPQIAAEGRTQDRLGNQSRPQGAAAPVEAAGTDTGTAEKRKTDLARQSTC